MATVFITGTNRGIGLEFVRQYLGRGDKVVASCRNISAASELQKLRDTNSSLTLIEHDVSDHEPTRTDTELEHIFNQAVAANPPKQGDPEVILAYEGLELEL